jgi:hypothetical protein
MLTGQDILTPRESILMEQEVEENKRAREHELAVKKLELESRAELKRLEVDLLAKRLLIQQEGSRLRRWPVLLLRLPLLPFVGLVLLFTIPLHRELPAEFWELLR